MLTPLMLLLQSRKAFVGLTTVLGAVAVAVVGLWRDVPVPALLGLLGTMTGISWKLMETIASEDNSVRLNARCEHDCLFDDVPPAIAKPKREITTGN